VFGEAFKDAPLFDIEVARTGQRIDKDKCVSMKQTRKDGHDYAAIQRMKSDVYQSQNTKR